MIQKINFCEKLEQVLDYFPKHHFEILSGHFNAKLGREDIFKPTFGNECLHQDSNDNGVRITDCTTSKNLIIKSTVKCS